MDKINTIINVDDDSPSVETNHDNDNNNSVSFSDDMCSNYDAADDNIKDGNEVSQ